MKLNFIKTFPTDYDFVLYSLHYSYFTDVHRGVLLSLSAVQKNEWCQDAFSAQLYVVSDTEMGTTSIRRLVRDTSRISAEPEEPQHPLIVQKLVFQRTSEIRNDLTFRCVGHFTKRSPPGESYFYVSSAYQSKWLYSDFNMHEKDEEKLTLLNYILLSPDFVENNQLEKRFLNVLRTISKYLPIVFVSSYPVVSSWDTF